jgi:hypothetical protein
LLTTGCLYEFDERATMPCELSESFTPQTTAVPPVEDVAEQILAPEDGAPSGPRSRFAAGEQADAVRAKLELTRLSASSS